MCNFWLPIKCRSPLKFFKNLKYFRSDPVPAGYSIIENVSSVSNEGGAPCAHCGATFSDPTIPHLCSKVKAVLDYQKGLEVASSSLDSKRSMKLQEMQQQQKKREYEEDDPSAKKSDNCDSVSTLRLSAAPSASNLDIPTPTSIEVLVRVRPLLEHESDETSRSATSVVTTLSDSKTVSINHPSKQLQCEYDYSFPQSATQEEVYDKVASCTSAVTDGFNSTIFAYGQTGSGKTFSMFGPDAYSVKRASFGGPNHAGA